MAKVFLLLRNNHQTGPYSLEELIDQNLKAADLVWMEGKSAGWSYPSEIEALKPFLSGSALPDLQPENTHQNYIPRNPPHEKGFSKNIFVSLPQNRNSSSAVVKEPSVPESFEKRAEALRQKAVAAVPSILSENAKSSSQTNYLNTSAEKEEDFTGWFYEQKLKKKKEVQKKQKAVAVAILILAGIGFAASQLFFNNSKKDQQPIIVQNEAIASKDIIEEPPQSLLNDTSFNIQKEEPAINQPALFIPKLANKGISVPSPSPISNKASESVPEKTEEQQDMQTANPSQSNETENTEIKKEEVIQPLPKEKKALGKFFEKLKRNKTEEPVAENEESGNARVNEKKERTRKKRETSSSTTEISLDKLDLKGTEKNNDWMMGVIGQKLTLHNRSSYIIDHAKAEILYYNEENSLLEKKLISFNNIAPKRSTTLAVPDHRIAVRYEYRLVSASAKEDGYVRQ